MNPQGGKVKALIQKFDNSSFEPVGPSAQISDSEQDRQPQQQEINQVLEAQKYRKNKKIIVLGIFAVVAFVTFVIVCLYFIIEKSIHTNTDSASQNSSSFTSTTTPLPFVPPETPPPNGFIP